jgi:hypothetical protein
MLERLHGGVYLVLAADTDDPCAALADYSVALMRCARREEPWWAREHLRIAEELLEARRCLRAITLKLGRVSP